ncbi:MAG: hypothetical protein ACPG4X_19635 [Pikeienuella sp.]
MARVGSTRHDHGNAADVFFYKDGRKLDWSKPADQRIFREIVSKGKAAGVTGFGAGPGYMQQGSMHIGFGTPSVWGAGGKGANAPQWLRDAYTGSAPSPGPVLNAAQQDFVRNNPQPGGFGPGMGDPNMPQQKQNQQGPGFPAFSLPGAMASGIPPDIARYATADESQPNMMQRLGAALSQLESGPPPPGSGFRGGAGSGSQLLKYLNSPTMAQNLMSKRVVGNG